MNEMSQYEKESVAKFFGHLEAPGFGLDDGFFIRMGQRLVDRAQVLPGSTVLDIASGTGTSLFPAAEIAGEDGKVIGTVVFIFTVMEGGLQTRPGRIRKRANWR